MKRTKKKSDGNLKLTFGKTKFYYDKSLDKYQGVVLFPEKLAKANKLLEGVKLPHEKEDQTS